jgi:NAD(P)-dependent dehydrogenase (short-subunit alcohol dehydrogenase family)
MEQLANRVAVITGGASGIGFATAEVMAREGMRLVLADIEPTALDAAVAKLRALGAQAEGVLCDVSDRKSVQSLADAAFERMGAPCTSPSSTRASP